MTNSIVKNNVKFNAHIEQFNTIITNINDRIRRFNETYIMTTDDQKLLSLLTSDARISTSELARKLGVSRSTIQSRIKKLEQKKIIKGYTVVYGADHQKKMISAHVLIKVDQKLTAKTNRELKDMPQLSAVHSISGDFDLIAILKTETTQELNHVLDEISNLNGVVRTNSSVILETKFSR